MPERERRRPTYLQTAVWATDEALSGEEIHDSVDRATVPDGEIAGWTRDQVTSHCR